MNALINIDVDSLDRAIHFYTQAFDLRVGRRFGQHGAELLGSSAPIYLLVKPIGTAVSSTISQQRTYARHWTPIHLDFVVDDLESAIKKAISAGAVLEDPVVAHNWGKIAHLADPFGHGFCILQFLGRGYDEITE
jgi:predicted enzyme related to lactoylglutathione lyase